MKYLDVFNNYIETDYDDCFVHNNYKLMYDFSSNKNKIYNIKINYKEVQSENKTVFEYIDKIYESKYYLYIEAIYYYVIDKSKITDYEIILVDYNDLVYNGGRIKKR